MANNRDLFTICERSLYTYINSGILMTKRGDLPRACSIKPRKGDKPVEARVDKSCRSGRTHDLFLERIAEKPGAMITEVDPPRDAGVASPSSRCASPSSGSWLDSCSKPSRRHA